MMSTMRAVRLVAAGRPLELAELPVPAIGPGEVLVRVRAAGICHSDVHYRAGVSPAGPLPLILGHEVAGVVERAGEQVTRLRPGDRVCLHYMVTCGDCIYCQRGSEQFCTSGQMLGKHRDGGYAEYIAVPARNAFRLPREVPFEQGAVMMCSAATALHALRKARLQPGEVVAVFGAGGLGMSAIQLAQAFGATAVYAVELDSGRLALAERLGAIPVNARQADPVAELRRLTNGRGVDVALELVGVPETMQQAVAALAIFGRAVLVGLSDQSFSLAPYDALINKEAEVIGCSDHLAQEIPLLIDLVRRGRLDLSAVVTDTVPLDAVAINRVLGRLERYGARGVRTVIVPADTVG